MDSGSLYSNMGPGMLGLEMSLHHQIPQQNTHHHLHQQPPPQPQPPPHHPMVSFAHQENADNQQQTLRQVFPFGNNKAKNQSLNFSDDDEPVPGVSADNNSTDDGKRNGNKTCPWQRMKWTDNMVRLLIMVVYYIGDEVGSEGNNNNDSSGKKKGGSGGGGGGGGVVGVLQKKGKWKSVSRAMMERGFYVSPQQCEDKFNDLNKRYKRVNDILGKGTSCRVVENQKLLETMDHLSPKMKEEVKKLLNSKHLFFREMCAYHNSCGHNGGSGGGASGSGVANPQTHQNQSEQQQRCLHSSENTNARIGASLVEGPKMPKGASGENDEENEDEEDEDEDEDDDDEVSGARGHDHDHQSHGEEDDDMDERSRKRQRKLGTSSPIVQQLSTELANVVQDRGRSPLEKMQWMKTKMIQLEEQHVSYLCQAFELQKQRLKWKKFISKKEREMERDKLINERKKLENERMVLLLKQKELELLDYHQHHPNNNNRNSDPSSVTG
ncbi:hypothetical protein KY289_035390 [Solanum tuberosum]|nr:hypothetical protein KY289_035390 [Solanum tuberosum]